MGIFNNTNDGKKIVMLEKPINQPTTYITSLNDIYRLKVWSNTVFNFNYISKFPNNSVAIYLKRHLQFGNSTSSINVYFRWKITCKKNDNVYYPGRSQKIKHPQDKFTIGNFGIQSGGATDALCSLSNTTIFITKQDESSYLFTLQYIVTDIGAISLNVPFIRSNSPNCGYVTSSVELFEVENPHVTGASGLLIYS